MLLPEPTYKGPENITYFRANSLAEELARDTKVESVLLIVGDIYPSRLSGSSPSTLPGRQRASTSPPSSASSPPTTVFQTLSLEKLTSAGAAYYLSSFDGAPSNSFDLFSYPEQAEQYHINASALSRQLPTMIMFQDGKELGRVPGIVNGKVQKFFFKEEDLVAAFDMNNLYQKCKEDKKFVPSEVKEANREAKKDK